MLLVILLSGIVSCVTKPPDVYGCVEVQKDEWGYCFKTISNKEQVVDNNEATLEGKKWSEVNRKAIRVPAESWAKIKTFILAICKKSKECSDNIGTWQKKLDKVDTMFPQDELTQPKSLLLSNP